MYLNKIILLFLFLIIVILVTILLKNNITEPFSSILVPAAKYKCDNTLGCVTVAEGEQSEFDTLKQCDDYGGCKFHYDR